MINIIIFILIITIIVWVMNKKLPFSICPICVGVSLTWIGLLIGIVSNQLPIDIYQLPTAILAGGTVVGSMYKLEKLVEIKFQLIWKTFFVIFGFFVIHSLVVNSWSISIIGIILMFVVTFIFREKKIKEKLKESKEQKKIQEKMKNCC